MALSLTIIALVAAGALAGIYVLTKGPIEATNEANKLKAKTEVLPALQDKDIHFADADTVVLEKGEKIILYRAIDADGNLLGTAVETFDKDGFNGLIKLMVGFDADGVIQGYSVLEQQETPGLGANMVKWFKTDKNNQSIIGRKGELRVKKDGGDDDVDAITAATISSRAFLRAVNRASKAIEQNNSSSAQDVLEVVQTALTEVVEDAAGVKVEAADDTLKVVQIKDTVIN